MYAPGDKVPLPQIREIALRKIQIVVAARLSKFAFVRNHLDFQVELDQLAQQLVCQLSSYLLAGERVETRKVGRIDQDVQWPADWWQALKERWLPAWLLRRWPVQYQTLSIHEDLVEQTITRVCPHIDLQTRDSQRVHFAWLEGR